MQEKKSNLWKEIIMQDLIYKSKHGSKLIWKCKDETWWWNSWMHKRRIQEDISSLQKSLMLKILLQKITFQTCKITIVYLWLLQSPYIWKWEGKGSLYSQVWRWEASHNQYGIIELDPCETKFHQWEKRRKIKWNPT